MHRLVKLVRIDDLEPCRLNLEIAGKMRGKMSISTIHKTICKILLILVSISAYVALRAMVRKLSGAYHDDKLLFDGHSEINQT